jgi:Xaa-Pro dipeptidase
MNVVLDIERPCSWEEHGRRLTLLKQELRGRKIDTLLVTSLHSIYYLFGIDRFVSAGVFVGVLVSIDKPPITISYFDHDLLFQQSPLVGEIRYWSKDYFEAADVVAQSLSDLGGRRRVGVESDHSAVPPRIHMEIEARLRARGAEIVDASDVVTRMRVVKSPAELKCMRRAAELLDIHFEAAFGAMIRGARECDVAGKAVAASYAAGSDYCIHPPLITSGVNTLFRTFHGPSQRQFKPGEVVVMEAGATSQRYSVVAGHTVLFGADPTAEQRKYYAAAREEVDASLAKLGPGVRASDLTRLVSAEMAGRDIHRGCACMIYSTGISFQDVWYESWPQTTQGTNDDEWILKPGTVVSVFGAAEKLGEYLMLCVDPVLITDTGYEMLTKLDRSELRVVG